MTDKRKQEIINEVIPGGERVTGTEFIDRLLERAAAHGSVRKARPYCEVAEEFFEKNPEFAEAYRKAMREAMPTAEEFNRRLDSRCAECSVCEYAETDGKAARACRRCRKLREQLKAEYAKTACETAQDGQDTAAGISPTDAKKRQEGGNDAPTEAERAKGETT